MKKILISGIMLASIPFAVFAQTASTTATSTTVVATTTATTTVTVDPGLAPGDFFYFLDKIGENLRLAFTFNKESKAKLHLKYARERVAEINKVLENPDATLADVAGAKENFQSQISDAATIVKSEKDSGKDVSGLAKELDDELDISNLELKDTIHQHQNEGSRAVAEIQAKIDAIVASGTASSTNANELQGLTQALESITKERMQAKEEEDSIDVNASTTQATFEDVMGHELSAQKHMEQALRLRGEMGQGFSAGLATTSDRFMRDAQAAMRKGDFEKAMNLSKDAQHALERAREIQGDIRMGTPPVQGLPVRGMMDGADSESSGNEGQPNNR